MLSGLKKQLHDTFSMDAVIEEGFAYKEPPPKLSPARKQALLNSTMLETPRSSLAAAMSIVMPYWTKSKLTERAFAATLLATSLFMTWYAVQVTVDFGDWSGTLSNTVADLWQTARTGRTGIVGNLLPQYPALMDAVNSDAMAKTALMKYPDVLSLTKDPLFADMIKSSAEFKELLGKNPTLEDLMMHVPGFKAKVDANPELLNQLATFKDNVGKGLFNLPTVQEKLKDIAALAGGDFIKGWTNAISTTFNTFAAGIKDGAILNEAAKTSLKAAWDQKDLPTIALKYTGMAVISYKSARQLGMRWRAWTTGYFTSRFMDQNAFLRIKNTFTNIDNPGQRIQEDPEKFTAGVVSLTTGVAGAGITMASFGGMLWGMGTLMGVPHGMFWLATAYAGALTAITIGAGWKLPWILRNKQSAEANLRRSIDDSSNNADTIAQNKMQGIQVELTKNRLKSSMINTKREVSTEIKLITVDATLGNLTIPIPYVVGGISIAFGLASMGTVQTLNYAFNRVASSLTIIVNKFKELADMKSVSDRMYMAHNAIRLSHYIEEEKRQLTAEMMKPPTLNGGQ